MKILTTSREWINRVRILNLLLLLSIIGFYGCKNNSLSYMVATRNQLMMDVIRQDTSLSIVVKALDKANLSATLNTYGPFTFFAPDNNAFRQYFKNKGKTSLDDFTSDALKTLLTYHILQASIHASDFIQGPQATPTGGGDFITLDISKGYKYNTVANGIARIYQTDIQYSNGIVHKMDGVLDPPTLTIGQFLSQNPNQYSIMTAGLKRAGLLDTLTALTDKNNFKISLTLFAETDDVLKAAGVTTFDNMPLADLKDLMLYHIIKGGNFSSSYTFLTAAIPGVNVVQRYDNTIMTLQGQNWIYFNLADTKLINNSTISFSASDVLMRNGLLHNVDKHMVFDAGTKRTQIFHNFSVQLNYQYGLAGFTNGSTPPNTTSGNWRIYAETGTGTARGTINCLFFAPAKLTDSLVTVVPNVRKGKYRLEVNYKSGGRGTYQIMCGTDNIGVPTNMGIAAGATAFEQKIFIGNYTFTSSGDKRIKFVPTIVGGLDLDCMVLTPVYN
jgi:uncharacterized surface protein with fasciclin (FAS1) repeats